MIVVLQEPCIYLKILNLFQFLCINSPLSYLSSTAFIIKILYMVLTATYTLSIVVNFLIYCLLSESLGLCLPLPLYCYVDTLFLPSLPLYCCVGALSLLPLPLCCCVDTPSILSLPLYCCVGTLSVLQLRLYCCVKVFHSCHHYRSIVVCHTEKVYIKYLLRILTWCHIHKCPNILQLILLSIASDKVMLLVRVTHCNYESIQTITLEPIYVVLLWWLSPANSRTSVLYSMFLIHPNGVMREQHLFIIEI